MLTLSAWGGCASSGQGALLSPTEPQALPQLAPGEGSALVRLRSDESASYHLLYVRGSYQARSLPDHDLTLFVMSGRMRLRLGAKDYSAGSGDVVEVPRGVDVTVTNASGAPSTAYLVVTPPLEQGAMPSARREPARESAWRWTRWGR